MGRQMTTAEKIAGYAFRFWKRSGMTDWPTVRQTARALRLRQEDIDEHSGDGAFYLTSYYTAPPEPLANHYVNADTPAVQAAWESYWAAWDASHRKHA